MMNKSSIGILGYKSLLTFNMRILVLVQEVENINEKLYYYRIAVNNFHEFCFKYYHEIVHNNVLKNIQYKIKDIVRIQRLIWEKDIKVLKSAVMLKDMGYILKQECHINEMLSYAILFYQENRFDSVKFFNNMISVDDLLQYAKNHQCEYVICKIVYCQKTGVIAAIYMYYSEYICISKNKLRKEVSGIFRCDKDCILDYGDSFIDIEGLQINYSELGINISYNKNVISNEYVIGTKLLHHPYDHYSDVIDFISRAAYDSRIISIRHVVYRSTIDSRIYDALVKAVALGKKVEVFIECRASCNEDMNREMVWNLYNNGVNVFTGDEGKYKVHAKLSVIEGLFNGVRKVYTHLGTGNYNEDTVAFYEDLSFFTDNHSIGSDAIEIFKFCCDNDYVPNLHNIIISPIGLKKFLFMKIEYAMTVLKSGGGVNVWIKCNSIDCKNIADKLRKLSHMGGDVSLMIRGLCTVSLKGISVYCVLGKYLEHSRIYWFKFDDHEEWYISSSDLRRRSFNKRIEFILRITDNKSIKILNRIKEDSYSSDDNIYRRKKVWFSSCE